MNIEPIPYLKKIMAIPQTPLQRAQNRLTQAQNIILIVEDTEEQFTMSMKMAERYLSRLKNTHTIIIGLRDGSEGLKLLNEQNFEDVIVRDSNQEIKPKIPFDTNRIIAIITDFNMKLDGDAFIKGIRHIPSACTHISCFTADDANLVDIQAKFTVAGETTSRLTHYGKKADGLPPLLKTIALQNPADTEKTTEKVISTKIVVTTEKDLRIETVVSSQIPVNPPEKRESPSRTASGKSSLILNATKPRTLTPQPHHIQTQIPKRNCLTPNNISPKLAARKLHGFQLYHRPEMSTLSL